MSDWCVVSLFRTFSEPTSHLDKQTTSTQLWKCVVLHINSIWCKTFQNFVRHNNRYMALVVYSLRYRLWSSSKETFLWAPFFQLTTYISMFWGASKCSLLKVFNTSTNDVHSHEMMTIVISVLENLFYCVTASTRRGYLNHSNQPTGAPLSMYGKWFGLNLIFYSIHWNMMAKTSSNQQKIIHWKDVHDKLYMIFAFCTAKIWNDDDLIQKYIKVELWWVMN